MEDLIKYCKKLKLGSEIINEFESVPFTNKKEFLVNVLKISAESQEIRRKNRLIALAKFDTLKTFENYSFKEIEFPEELVKEDILNCSYLEKHENLICYGPVGTGKTYLAIATGIAACNQGKKVRFYKVATLVNDLIEAYNKGTLGKLLRNLKKYDLLILDELGYVPIGEKGAELLFQVIADSYEKKSLIITTNIEFSKWNGVFMNKKITTAILDRVIHYGHLIIFTGESYRLKNAISRKNSGAF
ncbi:MAG: IS21-like element helper ATPase IstB [Fusobacterium sp.]